MTIQEVLLRCSVPCARAYVPVPEPKPLCPCRARDGATWQKFVDKHLHKGASLVRDDACVKQAKKVNCCFFGGDAHDFSEASIAAV